MNTENYLKEKLEKLCEKDPYIHIDVNLAKPHVELSNVRVKIIGVYKHIFQIEEEKNGRIERHSLQYGDIIAGIVKIAELK